MTYATELLADTPSLLWQLQDAAGATAPVDSSTNALASTTIGITYGVTGPQGSDLAAQGPGNLVSALRISAPDSAAIDFFSQDITVMGWVYPTSRAEAEVVLSHGSSYALSLAQTTGLPRFQHGASFSSLGTTAAPLNTWSHIAVRREAGKISHFLNGQPNGITYTATTGTTQTTQTVTAPVNGKRAYVALYGTALSDNRISILGAYFLTVGSGRVTQDPIEALIAPSATVRVTQTPIEALIAPSAVVRVTQAPIEALIAPSATVRITQLVIETLIPYASSEGAARVVWF